jgi:hypothetical protein
LKNKSAVFFIGISYFIRLTMESSRDEKRERIKPSPLDLEWREICIEYESPELGLFSSLDWWVLRDWSLERTRVLIVHFTGLPRQWKSVDIAGFWSENNLSIGSHDGVTGRLKFFSGSKSCVFWMRGRALPYSSYKYPVKKEEL